MITNYKHLKRVITGINHLRQCTPVFEKQFQCLCDSPVCPAPSWPRYGTESLDSQATPADQRSPGSTAEHSQLKLSLFLFSFKKA